jgi:transcriptional antiterminator NusG
MEPREETEERPEEQEGSSGQDTAPEPPSDAEPEAQAEVPAESPEGLGWYVVHTYSGFEKKVKESLSQRIVAYGMQDQFGQVLIPTEDVVEMKGGKKVVTQKKYFPGYILVQMKMSDNGWHLVRNTPKVTGFVGPERKPTSISQADVDKILQQVSTSAEKPKPKFIYEKGERVQIIDGPFSNFTGVVEEVNHVRNTLKVMVTIFGRPTPVELDFLQVEKS